MDKLGPTLMIIGALLVSIPFYISNVQEETDSEFQTGDRICFLNQKDWIFIYKSTVRESRIKAWNSLGEIIYLPKEEVQLCTQ